MCPNGGDYEDGRETKGLRTIIYGGMNASRATIFFHLAQSSMPTSHQWALMSYVCNKKPVVWKKVL